jgi:GH25 family lysozyme M1 (1,4-beta-N-acetylmuramidase)
MTFPGGIAMAEDYKQQSISESPRQIPSDEDEFSEIRSAVSAAETYARGIDASKFQSDIDWSAVRSDGIHFAFIKATQGFQAPEEWFASNWDAIKQAGIIRGAYHYFEPLDDPLKQAENYFTAFKLEDSDLPPVVDFEPQNTLPPENLQLWLDFIEKETGRLPIIYTNARIWQTLMGDSHDFSRYPLWFADYGGALSTPNIPADNWGGQGWAFWQHSERGQVAGISGPVNLNWFNGNEADLRAFMATGQPLGTQRLMDFALNDRPRGPDRLGYRKYVDAFARILSSEYTKTPLTIGIYAAWGMGKSFLMGKIEERLAPPEKPQNWRKNEAYKVALSQYESGLQTSNGEQIKFHFIKFNAWVYSGSENLWAGLITTLYQQVEAAYGVWRTRYFRLGETFRRSLKKTLSLLIGYGVLGILLSLLLDFSTLKEQWDTLDVALNALIGTAIGGSALAALPALIQAIRELFTSLALARSRQLVELSSRPDFRDKIGIMNDIKGELGNISDMIRKWDQRRKTVTRFVIFVDDLDRCKPEKAVEVLEAIMLLLTDVDGDPYIVFLGIDARVLVKAVEERYGKVLVDAGITGYEFLDKIVQIPFRIPHANEEDMKKYVRALLWHSEEAQQKKQTATELQTDERRSQAEAPSESRDTSSQGIDNAGETDSAQIPDDEEPLLIAEEPFDEAELQAFENYSPFLSPNPRRAKRIVNVYRIARQLKSNLGALAPEAPTLIKWMILSEQWPFRVAWIMQKIEDDYQLKQDLFNQPETSLEQVYEVVKPRVQDEKAKEFVSMDDDQEVFLMFIQQAPIITVDVVQKLRSLTFNLNPAMQSEVLKVAVTQDQNRAKDMIE